MNFSKSALRPLSYLLVFTVAYSPVINAGTIYLYLENKTDQPVTVDRSTPRRQDDPDVLKNSNSKDIINPHAKEIIGNLMGTPTNSRNTYHIEEGSVDYETICIVLPKFSKKVYLKTSSRAEGTKGRRPSAASRLSLGTITNEDYIPHTLKRVGLNWNISLDIGNLAVGTTEDVPGSKRTFIVTQDKDCGKACKKYKITATKKTYLIRAPDINFVVEEIQ